MVLVLNFQGHKYPNVSAVFEICQRFAGIRQLYIVMVHSIIGGIDGHSISLRPRITCI